MIWEIMHWNEKCHAVNGAETKYRWIFCIQIVRMAFRCWLFTIHKCEKSDGNKYKRLNATYDLKKSIGILVEIIFFFLRKVKCIKYIVFCIYSIQLIFLFFKYAHHVIRNRFILLPDRSIFICFFFLLCFSYYAHFDQHWELRRYPYSFKL